MRVCAILPRLATAWPPPFAASAFARSRVPLPELRVGVEARELLADVRVAGAARATARARRRSARLTIRLPPGTGSVAASPARRPSMPPFGPGYREAGVRAARADAGALEVERRLRDRPAVALAADQVGGVAHGVVEEHLVEHRLAGHLAQRTDRDAGLVEREREPGDAVVLRHREVGARRAACRSRPASPCCSTPSDR